MRTYIADLCPLLKLKKNHLFPRPHIEKALKSSKVKLVTLQIQNDLLYMQQNIQEVDFETKLKSLYLLGTIAIQF